MHEDEGGRLLGRGPELAQALVAEVGAARHGRDLDAAEATVVHELDELLGPLRVDRPEHEHALPGQSRERLVLPLHLHPAQVHPGREHDHVDARTVLLLEDAAEVGELAQRGADLAAPVRDDLDAAAPLDLGAEPGHDHVRVAVDDHAGCGRPTGAASAWRGSCPRSSSRT